MKNTTTKKKKKAQVKDETSNRNTAVNTSLDNRKIELDSLKAKIKNNVPENVVEDSRKIRFLKKGQPSVNKNTSEFQKRKEAVKRYKSQNLKEHVINNRSASEVSFDKTLLEGNWSKVKGQAGEFLFIYGLKKDLKNNKLGCVDVILTPDQSSKTDILIKIKAKTGAEYYKSLGDLKYGKDQSYIFNEIKNKTGNGDRPPLYIDPSFFDSNGKLDLTRFSPGRREELRIYFESNPNALKNIKSGIKSSEVDRIIETYQKYKKTGELPNEEWIKEEFEKKRPLFFKNIKDNCIQSAVYDLLFTGGRHLLSYLNDDISFKEASKKTFSSLAITTGQSATTTTIQAALDKYIKTTGEFNGDIASYGSTALFRLVPDIYKYKKGELEIGDVAQNLSTTLAKTAINRLAQKGVLKAGEWAVRKVAGTLAKTLARKMVSVVGRKCVTFIAGVGTGGVGIVVGIAVDAGIEAVSYYFLGGKETSESKAIVGEIQALGSEFNDALKSVELELGKLMLTSTDAIKVLASQPFASDVNYSGKSLESLYLEYNQYFKNVQDLTEELTAIKNYIDSIGDNGAKAIDRKWWEGDVKNLV